MPGTLMLYNLSDNTWRMTSVISFTDHGAGVVAARVSSRKGGPGHQDPQGSELHCNLLEAPPTLGLPYLAFRTPRAW